MPRKLMRPNVPSGAAPGVESTKFDQRRALTGRLLMDVWLMFVERSADSRLMTGVSATTLTDSLAPATPRVTSRFVTRPTSTTTPALVNDENPLNATSIE